MKYKSLFDRYFSIQKSTARPSDISVDIRKDVIEEELYAGGRLVLASNYIADAREAISAYRTKDLTEKNFEKKRLGLCKMRGYNDTRAQNKLLIIFIALILSCHIDKVMRDSELYKRYTIKGLMNKMLQIRRGSFNGKKIVQDLDKHQKEIIRTFGIPTP